MPFYRAVWAIYREWFGTVTDASCYSSEWNSTALAHCTTKLRGTAMSWQTKQVWAPKTSLTNFPFIKTTIHVHNFPQFPVTPQEQRLFFTKRIHISVNADAHFCDMKQGTTASLVNLSSSTTFKNHQEVSVSVLNLQSGKQAELNEQVPIHSKVGSWVSHGKDGPETYDLPERQCQDKTTAQHGSREGEKEGMLLHEEGNVISTISSFWTLPASQIIFSNRNNLAIFLFEYILHES